MARENCVPRKEVIGITLSGETRTLAEFVGTGWSLMDSRWSLHLQKKSGDDGHLFELMGSRKVCISSGSSLPVILEILGFCKTVFLYGRVAFQIGRTSLVRVSFHMVGHF